jgi:hypothetical protein
MKGYRLGRWWSLATAAVFLLPTLSWGYFFDDRREMSLSGFAYSRATFATDKDNIGTGKGLYRIGNLVQHRTFVTLEWRHNINRISRDMPTIGPLMQFLNFDAFDYYLNMREEYDGVWDYGPQTLQKQLDGGGSTNYWDKYFGRRPERYPGEFTRFKNFEYLTSIQWMEKKVNQIRLFEWYFNITKGPLFLRLGRQNLSWGETDGFRLLDQINPLDNLFGGFLVPLDERRVPLNMLRAQWSFGTVGPISDLTLEGFVSPDRRTNAWYALNQGSYWNVYTNTSPVEVGRMPCGGPYYGRRNPGPNDAPGNGIPCSVRAPGPHSDLAGSRGGARIVGTVNDFTFSIAHYYTWQDRALSAAGVLSPSPAHLAWDLDGTGTLFTRLTGKPAFDANGRPINNPWGSNDQVVGANRIVGGPGGFSTPAGVERNLWVPIREKRIQVSGASLSFPVNALTGMFVGSDNPLYYIYSTFRSEFAYFNNTGVQRAIHDGIQGATPALQRFLSLPLTQAGLTTSPFINPQFLPGGHFASEGNCTDAAGVRGCRLGKTVTKDAWAFSLGIDHNQWIRFLNPNNSFTISAQLLKSHMYTHTRYTPGLAPSLLNDIDVTAVTRRSMAPIGPNRTVPKLLNRPGGPGNRTNACLPGPTAPCQTYRTLNLGNDQEIFTFNVNTQYWGGNLRPSFTFFYDWAGAWLIQPGLDWTFWDPFRASVRYNWLEGNYQTGFLGGIGTAKNKDNVWIELQYLLY